MKCLKHSWGEHRLCWCLVAGPKMSCLRPHFKETCSWAYCLFQSSLGLCSPNLCSFPNFCSCGWWSDWECSRVSSATWELSTGRVERGSGMWGEYGDVKGSTSTRRASVWAPAHFLLLGKWKRHLSIRLCHKSTPAASLLLIVWPLGVGQVWLPLVWGINSAIMQGYRWKLLMHLPVRAFLERFFQLTFWKKMKWIFFFKQIRKLWNLTIQSKNFLKSS